MIGRARDPHSGGWLYRARKRPDVADAALNGLASGPTQVDHLLLLKCYGAASSLARWGRLLGFRWDGEEGDGAWRGTVCYPDVRVLNRRLAALGRAAGGFRFVARADGLDVPHLDYAADLGRGRIPVAGQGSTHFHDMFTHVLGYAMYPGAVVRQIAAQAQLLARLYREAEALVRRHGGPEAAVALIREWVVGDLTHLAMTVDRHSTFLPMLALPKDSSRVEKRRLALVDGVEHALLRRTRRLASLELLRRLARLFSALETPLLYRHGYIDAAFAWLENKPRFAVDDYLGFARTVVRDAALVRQQLVDELEGQLRQHADGGGLIRGLRAELAPAATLERLRARNLWWALALRPRIRRELLALIAAPAPRP